MHKKLRRRLSDNYAALRHTYRVLSSPLRVSPDFVIIGTQKGGTTSLFDYLRLHPNFGNTETKETQYFSQHPNKSFAHYKANFPTVFSKWFMSRGGRPFVTGEATPEYMFHPHAPRRLFEVNPHMKIIALLRDPVERAYSNYKMERRKGRESLSFEDALKQEEKRLEGVLERLQEDEQLVVSNFLIYSYKYRGHYFDHLEQWKSHFPEDQILVIKSETLFNDPKATYKRVLDFLGLPEWYPTFFENTNPGNYNSQIAPMTRQQLEAYFAPHNKKLKDAYGDEFSWE